MILNQDIGSTGANCWDGFVGSHAHGSVYHHSLWHRVMEKTYGFKTVYQVRYGGEKILAGAPAAFVKTPFGAVRLLSYPFSDYCDPLVRDEAESTEFIGALEHLKDSNGFKSIEIRLARPWREERNCGRPEYVNFSLRLEKDPDSLFRSFHRDCVQRAVKKALKGGVEAYECDSIESVKDFYGLHVLTRKRHGVPVQPFIFFKNLWELFSSKAMISVYLARKDGKTAAAIVILKYKKTAYYKFGASEKKLFNCGANQLLMWHAIKNAAEAGFEVFDLGKTCTGNTGLMEYKSRWGAEMAPLRYLRLPASTGSFKNEGGALNRILSGVFKRMPAFSVRCAGEILYKYLA